MNSKLTLGLVAVGVVLLFAAFTAGKGVGSADAEARAAVEAARATRATRDSIRTENDRRDDERQRQADSVRRVDSLAALALKRRTDAVVASAVAVRQSAEQTLANANATAGELRISLEESNATNIALTAQLAEERQTAAATLARRDSTHAEQLGALRADHARERAADDVAYQTFKDGVAKQVRAAERRGVNRGRMQTIGGLGLAAIAVVLSR